MGPISEALLAELQTARTLEEAIEAACHHWRRWGHYTAKDGTGASFTTLMGRVWELLQQRGANRIAA